MPAVGETATVVVGRRPMVRSGRRWARDYRATVTNLGGTVSTGATVTDTLPAGLTPSSARINGQACQVRGRIVAQACVL
jgi:hypothetical protein